jgi:hypothetical protein
MSLPGAQRKALHGALLQAFPDPELLKHWVRWGLNWNLAEISTANNLSAVVFDLIEHAHATGTLPTLLDAAIRAAPQNTTLREIAAGLGLVVDVPLDAPSTLPPLRPHVVLTRQEQHNRRTMIARVRNTWIVGVLEQSLYAATRIELGLQADSAAVADPWRLVRESPDWPAEMLPPGTTISQVYNRTDGSLLILGAPGAGKTTLLLELARTRLDQAEHDLSEPIPVVFHLSAWATTRRPLVDWLVAELREKYYVQEKVGRHWVEGDQLLVLLDGLDEVVPSHRVACTQAINTFRREHGLTPLVVCSRETEYRALAVVMAVNQAVVVQPLTLGQVAAYLDRGGSALAAVRIALDTDPELHDLLENPLMLNVLALAYEGVPSGSNIPATRQQIFVAYIKRMLTRKTISSLYTPQQMQHWLAYLSRQMVAHSQTVFYIERLQPNWLPRSAQTAYRWLTILILGLITGLGPGLILGLSGELGFGLVVWLGVGLGVGLGIVLIIDLLGLTIFGLGSSTPIAPAETLLWSGVDMRRGLLESYPIGVAIAILSGLGFNRVSGPGSALVGGLTFGLIVWLGFAFVTGFSMNLLDDRNRSHPNQGMWQSARNGVIGGLSFGLLGGLPIGLLNGLISWLDTDLQNERVDGLAIGLAYGLSLGLVGGLQRGWGACIVHIILRLMLWRTGAVPLNIVHFLDYATERILLHKVGGGYIFIHRLLLEYFAGLEPSAPVARPEPATSSAVESSPTKD